MLKKLNPELIIGFLLASVFWVGVLLWQSSPPDHAGADNKSCEGTKSECAKATTDERIADYTWWLAVLTAALVSVSAVQGFFLLRSDKTARIAADAARDGALAASDSARIARNTERPYFTPFTPELRHWSKAIRDINPFQILEVHLDIHNIGKGIGFFHSYGIAHEICRDGLQGGVPLAVRSDTARMPLRADAKFDAGAPFDNLQINADDRLAMIEFEITLFVYGYIRYYDLFGIFRKTGFMFQFIPDKYAADKSTFAMVPHAMWYDEEEPKTA